MGDHANLDTWTFMKKCKMLEGHPARSSRMLSRVSMINIISYAPPWLSSLSNVMEIVIAQHLREDEKKASIP